MKYMLIRETIFERDLGEKQSREIISERNWKEIKRAESLGYKQYSTWLMKKEVIENGRRTNNKGDSIGSK